ncbi:Glycosyltransferase involved in cell wall bisynthesis [[Clostridium] aminophilum]|uniref:Glycosyltransferase involved in cell wall bisynthesis n=1 Tax=[Clostridium] aminophilum TaxID=1526 RepID=A0A1I0FJ85_9FIRM|nr:glycosyltransferase [[Clostridium] aminophilum]SET58089.1 Glycosyltransferase involved in cell wall bisynthesis [[Clostridium] aminophilum]
MSKLYLFSMGFPYPGKSMETYLETECQYYGKFEEVNICALEVLKADLDKKRDICCGTKTNVYPILFGSKVKYLFYSILSVLDKNFYVECRKLIREKKFDLGKIRRLVKFFGRSHCDANQVIQTLHLNKSEKVKNAVIYTYRFEYQAYVCSLLSRYFDNPVLIARAHGYDLYEERNSNQYIPCREQLLKSFDRIYLIAKDGIKYLTEKYPQYSKKYFLSYLGTQDKGIEEYESDDTFRIVSCSNILPGKRVDRIIEVLSELTSPNIEWIHFGDGPSEGDIKELAKNKLQGKIKYQFMGRRSNTDILEYYKNNSISLFINLSESEGLPVSIMEAMSFGIPCVATDVGGTGEIVIDGYNGWLVNTEDACQKIANIIDNFCSSVAQVTHFRTNARNTWEKYFNADTNYNRFVQEIIETAEQENT